MRAMLILILSVSCSYFSAADMCLLSARFSFKEGDKLILTTNIIDGTHLGTRGTIFLNNNPGLSLRWAAKRGSTTVSTSLARGGIFRTRTDLSTLSHLSISFRYESENNNFRILLSTESKTLAGYVGSAIPTIHNLQVFSVTWNNVPFTCERVRASRSTTTTTTTRATTTAKAITAATTTARTTTAETTMARPTTTATIAVTTTTTTARTTTAETTTARPTTTATIAVTTTFSSCTEEQGKGVGWRVAVVAVGCLGGLLLILSVILSVLLYKSRRSMRSKISEEHKEEAVYDSIAPPSTVGGEEEHAYEEVHFYENICLNYLPQIHGHQLPLPQ